MDLWKYSQSLTILKFLAIKWLGFSKNFSLIWVYNLYYIIYCVLISNLECEST
jgi:hypothetical protein